MDPFWLTFTNPATERAYNADRLNRLLMRADDIHLRLGLCFVSGVLMRYALIVKSPLGSAMWAAQLLYTIWEIRKRQGMTAQQLLDVRVKLLFVRRVLHIFLMVATVTRESSLGPGNPFAIGIKSGLTLSLVLSVSVRLNFAHHLPCQLIFTFSSLALATKGPCNVAMSGSLGPHITSFGRLMTSASDLVVGIARGPPLVEEIPPDCPCLHVIVCLHIFVLAVFVSFWLWMQERAARVAFIHSLPHDRSKNESLDAIKDIPDCGIFLYLLVLVSLLATGWKLSDPVVRLVDNFGIALR